MRAGPKMSPTLRSTEARLLFTSTAAVFDGSSHGYCEEDEVAPLSVYGKTKAWAENAVMTLTPSAVMIRFALVLGFARKNGTNAMLDSVMGNGKRASLSPFLPEKREIPSMHLRLPGL